MKSVGDLSSRIPSLDVDYRAKEPEELEPIIVELHHTKVLLEEIADRNRGDADDHQSMIAGSRKCNPEEPGNKATENPRFHAASIRPRR